MKETELIELRYKAMYAACSSAVANDAMKRRRKDISDYLRALRNSGEKYKFWLVYDMMTIKRGFGILKTPYRKLLARRMKFA